MTALIIIVTLVAAAVPVYVFAVYPVLLWLLAKMVGKSAPVRDASRPRVTMIVSCFNEAAVVPQKIANCLAIDYPNDRLDFVFVSDASDDGTDELVRAADESRIRLVRQSERKGKTLGLNLAMAEIDADVVVFSDANAMYEPDSVSALVAPFADATVGYVVGAALYDATEDGASGQSEGLYWRYEIWLKQRESELHSVVGGDGAIYAIRRELFWPFDREDINDLVNPLQIIKAGYRGIFERHAVCIEHTADDFGKEGRRKRRIVNRSFSAVLKHRAVLNPLRNWRFAFSIWSHKVLRWLLAPFIAIAIAGTLVLGVLEVPVFNWGLPFVLALLACAVLGYLWRSRASQPLFTAVPYYFFLVAWQATLGLMDSLRGEVKVTWDPPRADAATGRVSDPRQALAVVGLIVLLVAIAWSVYRLLFPS